MHQKDETVWELQKGLFDNTPPKSDQNSWQAFPEPPPVTTTNSKSVRTRNGHQNSKPPAEAAAAATSWGFEAESFTAVPTPGPQVNVHLNHFQRFGDSKNKESKSSSQPAGWAGF